ncbi:hypothetical protein ACJX0J_018250, partial [Zea mays]
LPQIERKRVRNFTAFTSTWVATKCPRQADGRQNFCNFMGFKKTTIIIIFQWDLSLKKNRV